MNRLTILLLAASLLCACRTTEDYLTDLHNSLDRTDSSLNLGVYDSGQLIHESLAGLMGSDVLSLTQMGRAVYQAGRILDGNEVPLLRAGAVNLLAHVALRYPLPPLDDPFSGERASDVGIALVEEFHRAMEPLQAGALIDGLESPDRVVAEENYARLLDVTGRSLPMDPNAWRQWWDSSRETFLAQAQEGAREPLRRLGKLQYGSLANARVILGFLSASARIHELPALKDDLETALVRLARQVVVHGINRSLRHDPDPDVRAAAARAAGAVLDPSFGRTLLDRLLDETSAPVRAAIVQALAPYPGRASVQTLIALLSDPERNIRILAASALDRMAGESLGSEQERWVLWWDREGKDRWP